MKQHIVSSHLRTVIILTSDNVYFLYRSHVFTNTFITITNLLVTSENMLAKALGKPFQKFEYVPNTVYRLNTSLLWTQVIMFHPFYGYGELFSGPIIGIYPFPRFINKNPPREINNRIDKKRE